MQEGGSRGQGRRRLGAAWFLCLPGAGLTVLRLIPWDIGTPWIQLLPLFPASVVVTAAAAALAVLALCLDSRPRRTVLAAAVTGVTLLHLAMVLPRVLPRGGAGRPRRLRVRGLAPIWPANSQVPPIVAPNHVLVTPGIGILAFATFTVHGTDHTGVVAGHGPAALPDCCLNPEP